MSAYTDKELEQTIAEAIAELDKTSSDNELTQIGWLGWGVEVYKNTDGKRGFSKEKAAEYIISSVARLIAKREAALKQELKQSLKAQTPEDLEMSNGLQHQQLMYRLGFNESNGLHRKAIDSVFQDKGDNRE